MLNSCEAIDLLVSDEEAVGLDDALEKEIAQECRLSFFAFVQEFWSVIIEEEPVWNWHIPYICTELQKLFYSVVMRKTRKHDLIINIPPGTTKSTIVTVMFQAWCWIAELPKDKFASYYKRYAKKHGKDVNDVVIRGAYLRFITGSYAEKLSIEHSEYAQQIIQSDKYKRYFPELRLKKNKMAKSNFVNTKKGQRFTTSVGSTVTGVHAHFIVIDDPVDPNQSISEKERLTANHWTDQTLSTRKVDKRITITIMIMQRLHLDDPTGHMMDVRDPKTIKHIVLPDTTENKIKPIALADHYVDGLLDPIRLNRKVLKEQRRTLGAYGYAGQFGQNPVPKEGATFQEEWFEIVDSAPAKVEKRVRGWDLAATSEAEAAMKGATPAYTACVLMSKKGSTFYIEHVWRKRVNSKKTRTVMRAFGKSDGVETIIDFPQDPGQAGKDQAQEIASYLAGFVVKFSRESGDKLTRLDPLSSQAEIGNIKLVKGRWNRDFLDELSWIPNGKFWDQADAAARAFSNLHIPTGKKGGGWGSH
jgi:predicted phage terminase large subunit-like protein